ncbi:bifunctional protein tyrosine phosphatase family protein/NAD(P)/FAD-dependent oxidoreductase [Loktanella sp. M215]|uniref:bifunctional protein tyrosine phosphatase family protein/NAD(P)/FAD-dependent oxidoreductase n=1 Tax=Loktanella sp. M215 TaxID=2675431 RepID=UPI001F32C662|nr:bifunctional protein tyrosine phosphatase family protein/NAD(P)/FAD-dependent oxidoreductase [Loktanella sp. M215]MCF7698292.1 TIGR01244 family phosphatase [Loktanella sp. M215]
MDIRELTDQVSVAPQVALEDMTAIKAAGFASVISNRPDGESADQPSFAQIRAAAEAAGLQVRHLPVVSGQITDADVAAFGAALEEIPAPVLAFCKSGTRAATLWTRSEAGKRPEADLLARTHAAGYDMTATVAQSAAQTTKPLAAPDVRADIVIVGAGSAGIAVAASLLARDKTLDITIIDPSEVHYYQPGWTMVGGGIFDAKDTKRQTGPLIPDGVTWIKAAVADFTPDADAVILGDGRVVGYTRLIVCPGLELNWDGIAGLSDTLGRNGVTSNYRYDLAPYTWKLVQQTKGGRALFTQPPMPIKCAGAPQKAMYLSCDAWHRAGVLKDIDVQFMNAGGVLFGVKDYVPALMRYVEKYDAHLNFFHTLTAIDGAAKTATFKVAKPDTAPTEVTVDFEMIHVCPPQRAPGFIRNSPLADAAGWVDVDQATLRHKTYQNIWSLGDVMNAPNAKTMAAARKQAPVVADNIMADIHGKSAAAIYDGYGSCPLTVERGKIVLAEFGYGGKLLPSFPTWLIDGTQPSRLAWTLKAQALPQVYWHAMLKGREWMAEPEKTTA